MRTLTLNEKQQHRVDILVRLDSGTLDTSVASQLLGVSRRQVRRLRARFADVGMEVVVHGNKDRSPVNRTDPFVLEHVIELVGGSGKYHDLNVCHLHDLLVEQEEIMIGRSTLDRVLRQHGLRGLKSTGVVVHRRHRTRRTAEGMMVQMDGSPFEWLKDQKERISLLGAVDDATGKVVGLLLRPTEDQVGYLMLLRSMAKQHGLPMAIYHDRHTMLCSPKRATLEEELAGEQPMSQIQRLLAELGIESIPAHSPQAKGRVERLWGTLQDRLVKEMHLADVTNLEDANTFLGGFIQRYNTRFAKAPQDPKKAWTPLPAGFDLDYNFSVRESRKVRADHCIQWQGQVLQLDIRRDEPVLVGRSVSVHTVPEGRLYVYHGDRRLQYHRVAGEQRATIKGSQGALPTTPKLKTLSPAAQARRRAWLFGHR
jgi:hypothetical protein